MLCAEAKNDKKAVIKALEKSLGIVSTACKSADVGRTQFYHWYKTDIEFKKQVQEIENIALDFAESHLHKLIQDGNPSATIFYLKTKGKKRGYIERQEVEVLEKKPLTWMDEVVKKEGRTRTTLVD